MVESNLFDNEKSSLNERVLFVGMKVHCPDRPLVPYYSGGAESSWQACARIVEAAVSKAYGNRRSISWVELLAGKKAQNEMGEWLPAQSLDKIKELGLALFGPLPEPFASGIRSRLRRSLHLPFQLRPIGNPYTQERESAFHKSNIILIETRSTETDFEVCFENGSPEARSLGELLHLNGSVFSKDSNFHIEAFSEKELKELIDLGLYLNSSNPFPGLTFVHGHKLGQSVDSLFKKLSYKIIDEKFRQKFCLPKELSEGWERSGKTLLRHELFENFLFDFQKAQPPHSIIISNPLLSDGLFASLAFQTGLLKLAPRQLLGPSHSIFCSNSHAADDSNQDEFASPLALIFAACQLLDFLTWREASALIRVSVKRAVEKKLLSFEQELMKRPSKMCTADYATVIIDNIVKD